MINPVLFKNLKTNDNLEANEYTFFDLLLTANSTGEKKHKAINPSKEQELLIRMIWGTFLLDKYRLTTYKSFSNIPESKKKTWQKYLLMIEL